MTDIELRTLLLQKNRRKASRASRVESAEARKTFDQDQGKSADTEKATKKTQNKHFNWEFDCETRESRNSSRRLLPGLLFNSYGPRRR